VYYIVLILILVCVVTMIHDKFLELSVLTKNGEGLRKHETVVYCNIRHCFYITKKWEDIP
jgi:hypothetical protein